MEGKAMAVSEKKRASNAKWDRANMATVACSLRKEQAAAFRAYCEARGMTSNTAIKTYVMGCIEGGEAAPQKPSGAPAKAGVVSLSPDTLEAVERAADAAGEAPAEFIARTVLAAVTQSKAGTAPEAPQETGAVSLPSETVKAAQEAAQAAGEGLPQFIARAVDIQAQRDALARKMEGGEPNE